MIQENFPTLEKQKERKEGVSAMLRVKNGEDYLEKSILSIVDQVDEIICVYNDCSDRTEDILLKLESDFSKIRVYKYVPKVYPPNTTKYLREPENSVHSLVYYYNFALSKTTRKYVFKFDDDEIYFPNIIQKYKDILEEKKNCCIAMRGINLFDLNSTLYINSNESKTSGLDKLFFEYKENNCYKKSDSYEVFFTTDNLLFVDDCFYHTKRCKKDRGIDNYNLTNNPESRYMKINKDFFKTLKLIPFQEWNREKDFPDPFSVGFEYVNESVKQYSEQVFQELERKIK